MNKYIIKNCPAFDCKYNECHSKIGNHKLYCMDCTDCLLKQIVEKCEEAVKTFYNNEFYEDEFDIFMGEKNMAEEIISMLEIQECE